jgi:protein disulfide-isomerase A1
MVYLFAPTEAERASLRKSIYSFARDQYSSLSAATVDPFEFPDLQASLGLEPDVFPAGAVHQLSKDRIYPYPRGQPYSSAALQKWGLDVYQGRVRPWTPPGVTTSYDDLGLGGKMTATRKISIAGNWPGAAKIKIAGRDEL